VTASQATDDQEITALSGLLEVLDLPDTYKSFMRSRWLQQVSWMEARASRARSLYYLLRLVTIIGGLTIPALVGLNASGRTETVLESATFVLSLIVAICAAIEGFFRFGDRWRHYRQTAEWLKSEGWRYLQLADRYARFPDHLAAYSVFARRIEMGMAQEVESYITEVTVERRGEQEQKGS
jgi:hypothetical protein